MSILKEFIERKEDFISFERKIIFLIEDLISSQGIGVHQISSRVKSESSLEGKIISKSGKYKNLFDITDCVGIRIITYFENQVDEIAKLISEEFLIDVENSVDKRNLEVDRFGYKSLHYVVSLNESRLKLKEYSNYEGFKAEIQIRTILQHAWAEIEHDLGYKTEISTPDFLRRDFFRVAALLETADKEFEKIDLQIGEYQKKIKKDLKKNPSQLDIDQETLSQYLKTSKIIDTITKGIIKGKNLGLNGNLGNLNYVLETLEKYNVKTISELDTLLKKRSKHIIDFYRKLQAKENISNQETASALGIHGLVNLILLEKNDKSIYKFDEDSTFSEMNAIRKSYSEE